VICSSQHAVVVVVVVVVGVGVGGVVPCCSLAVVVADPFLIFC
jgi:hypothetical protein